MKKILLILLISTFVFSCKNTEEKKLEAETTETDSLATAQTYRGEFIFSDEVGVFMGNSFIYGVTRNELAKELAAKVATVKKTESDMVMVTVKGNISKNTTNESQWEEVITIKEIIHVSDKPSEADIKLEDKKS